MESLPISRKRLAQDTAASVNVFMTDVAFRED